MSGTAYKNITDEKFPNAAEFFTESGIALANHKNFCTFDDVLLTIGAQEMIDLTKEIEEHEAERLTALKE